MATEIGEVVWVVVVFSSSLSLSLEMKQLEFVQVHLSLKTWLLRSFFLTLFRSVTDCTFKSLEMLCKQIKVSEELILQRDLSDRLFQEISLVSIS